MAQEVDELPFPQSQPARSHIPKLLNGQYRDDKD
jgi:hypothetical protein